MSCLECQTRLMEADPRALAEAPPDHARTCDECRLVAERILAAHEQLAAGLEVLEPALPLAEAVSAAIRESDGRRNRVRTASWAVAAATVACLLGVRALDVGGGAGIDTLEVVASRGGLLHMTEVEALLDESVLVLETDNDDVVVFWFYQGREE